MPTYNRRAFLPHAIRYFLQQDYSQKELIIIDDGTDNISDLVPVNDCIRYYRLDKKITLGAKMNLACTYAKGNIIVNWDDDDWYAERRLSYQVTALKETGTSVCGINKLLYYDLGSRKGYQYIYPDNQRVWLLGSSLCFTRELWYKNPFADINVGMDGLFIWATPPTQVKVLEDHSFSVHMIHKHNISPKNTNSSYWHSYPVENLQEIMNADWNCYINDGFHLDNLKTIEPQKITRPVLKNTGYKLLKNVYACLVHENEDCITDLVRNLNYQDPDSRILLYNGSDDPGLLTKNFPYENYSVVIHPKPVPQQLGYLHKFALDCMEYALENFPFDTFTIIDSDQLCIRKGYTEFLSRFLSTASNVGMLSCKPERVLPGNTKNLVAAQAYKEHELWKPFLQNFPDGENKFVYWTFWPSTVFTSAAIRDLVTLFRENKQLQEIMRQTKIWATEEIVFPTLVRLLGYEIATNPCSYDFVKYRKSYTTQDIDIAFKQEEVYWIHPVERRYENSLRKYTRSKLDEYGIKNHSLIKTGNSVNSILNEGVLIKRLGKIEGWLSDNEARLLIEFTQKICAKAWGDNNIVEIGSYHGKSTVLFGSIMKSYNSPGKVYAIDTHDGKLGAVDQGLKSYPPSYGMLKKNIADATLSNIVEIIKDKAVNVKWDRQLALLFIDGLHDYRNVTADFNHFSEWVKPGGYVAFHDYADYYPGVLRFVDELLAMGTYKKVGTADSLVVIQNRFSR